MTYTLHQGTQHVDKAALDAFYGAVFCRSLAEYKTRISKDLFGNELNTKQYIEEYFNVKFD